MNNIFSKPSLGGFFLLHNQEFLDKQRIAGNVAKQCIAFFKQEFSNKSMKQLDLIAEEIIRDNKCVPTFKNYKGFPATTCISINNELVHGIPKDTFLKDGDLVSFDIGVTFEGAIADTATTCIKNQPDNKLIIITKECLIKAIQSIKVGKQIGVIGNSIYKHALNNNFSVITNYGGHFITWNTLHVDFISNKSRIDEGIRIQTGMTLAIEPLLCIGNSNTFVDNDGWTVKTYNLCAHEEHTIFIHDKEVEVIA